MEIRSEPGMGPDLTDAARLAFSRLEAAGQPSLLNGLYILPVRGRKGAGHRSAAAAIAAAGGRRVAALRSDSSLLSGAADGQGAYLNMIGTLCWLKGLDLFIDAGVIENFSEERRALPIRALPNLSLPVLVYLGIGDRRQLPRLPAEHCLPLIDIPELGYEARERCWREALGEAAASLQPALAECARRFRFGQETIQSLARGLLRLPGPPDRAQLIAACQAELDLDIGELAQRVLPRFQDEPLILPPAQQAQFREVARAMRALAEVHYHWGTARVWNEGGITALFAGPPGTGKTMAAEILAIDLELPMYRIDLSQVVNKYIGETEKNLKRIFDAADVSDILLFFDEADALFGARTEVRDSHDRYANLEISYLLERMERFKGMAILATNRKKDLDEAFLRRLRYIVDFPLPGLEQRRLLWKQVVPPVVDDTQVDYDFLARQFPLTGGSIRSIIFNACLQSAAPENPGQPARLEMEPIIVAVKREYDKMNRVISLENFGQYVEVINHLERHERR
jgi:hypothetical protein